MFLSKYNAWAVFVGGLATGLLVYQIVLWLNGLSLVSRQELERRQTLLAEVQEENRELTEELFRPRVLSEIDYFGGELPYDADTDARSDVTSARQKAREKQKFLMVTFGANWCMDCRTLHLNLKSEDVKRYTEGRFDFVNVDVGKFNQNAELAAELGVSLSRGIPVAIFFDPSGALIGTTNEGQLEPARRYTSKQILKFVRDIAERSVVLAPDQVRVPE
jgi:thioredoxin-related protein